MAPYTVGVPVRWSDQDAYGHVNHARVVTLLEEARAALMFDAAVRQGVVAFEAGLLVAALDVQYRRPIAWSPAGVRVAMEVLEVRAASFRVGYRLLLPRGGDGDAGADCWDPKPAVEATTQLVPYDLDAARPRRLTAEERDFVASYTPDPADPAE